MQGRPSGPLSTQSPDRHISAKISQQFFWKTRFFFEKLAFFEKNLFLETLVCQKIILSSGKFVESKSQVTKRKQKTESFQESRSWTLSAEGGLGGGGGALCTRPVCTASWKPVSMALVTRAKRKKNTEVYVYIYRSIYIYIYIYIYIFSCFSSISRQNCLICAIRAFAYKQKRLMIFYLPRDVSKLCDPNPRLWTSSVNKYGVIFWKGCVNCAHLVYTPFLNQEIDKNEIRKRKNLLPVERGVVCSAGLSCLLILLLLLLLLFPHSSFLFPPSSSSSLVWLCSCSWYDFRSVPLFTCIHIYTYLYLYTYTLIHVYIYMYIYI